MHQLLKTFSNGVKQLNEQVGRAVSWLTGILILLVCADVIVRYALSDSRAWVMELEWHLFSLIFLLGAGYALKHDRHVRVDLFYANFSTKDKALVNLLGALLFLIPWSLLILVVSFDYAMISYRIGETSPDPGGLPARYVIKFSVTLGAALLLLQGIADLIDAADVYFSKEPSETA